MPPLVTTYFWDFGDGYTSNEEVPVHHYNHPGVYLVVLTVYNDGVKSTATTTVTVADPTHIELTQFCLRLAVEPSQGIEWSEISGTDWVSPIDVLYIIDDNDVPRMLIEDENDDMVWEDATFDRVIFQRPAFVDKYYEDSLRSVDYRWLLSAGGTNEYYLDLLSGGDPDYDEPKQLEINDILATQGIAGTLAAGTWAFGDNDVLGYDTVYVRLSDNTDPDTKTLGYIVGIFWTEIPTETWYGEDTSDAAAEEAMQEITELHWYTRPYEPQNKGKTGYDSNGYRTEQEFALDIYKDGSLVRPYAQVSEIPENGDIVFSGITLQGRRFQPVFKTLTSEFMVVGRNLSKIIKPMAGNLAESTTDRTTAETAFATPAFFIGRDRERPLLERVSGIVIPGTVTTAIGPDGNAGSAIVIPAAGLNLGNAAIAGAYTFLLWRSTVAPVSTIPALPALTQVGATYSNWQLMYVTGIGCPANLVITQGTVAAIRLYAADIVTYLTLYYNSMRYDEEPKQFEPGL